MVWCLSPLHIFGNLPLYYSWVLSSKYLCVPANPLPLELVCDHIAGFGHRKTSRKDMCCFQAEVFRGTECFTRRFPRHGDLQLHAEAALSALVLSDRKRPAHVTWEKPTQRCKAINYPLTEKWMVECRNIETQYSIIQWCDSINRKCAMYTVLSVQLYPNCSVRYICFTHIFWGI